MSHHGRAWKALGALSAALALLLSVLVSAASASTHEAAWWQLDSRTAPRYLVPGQAGQVESIATELGDAGVAGISESPVVLHDVLPAWLRVTSMTGVARSFPHHGSPESRGSCEALALSEDRGTEVVCRFEPVKLEPYESVEAKINVIATEAHAGTNFVAVSGGETTGGPLGTSMLEKAPAQSYSAPIEAANRSTPFGVERYELRPETETGGADSLAGSHPFQLTSTIDLNQDFGPSDGHVAVTEPAEARNVRVVLPPGLVANITAVPQCSDGDFATLLEDNVDLCSPETAIGVAAVTIDEPDFEVDVTEDVPVFNLVPPPGEPARFGFLVDKVPVYLDTEVLTGGNYAAAVTVHESSSAAELLASIVTIWGEPGDVRHDRTRGWGCVLHSPLFSCEPPHVRPSEPYLRLPTSCFRAPEEVGPYRGEPYSEVTGESWPVGTSRTGIALPPFTETLEPLQGCEELPFSPTIDVRPEADSASTPTGLNVTIKVPKEGLVEDGGHSQPDIRSSTVALPEGVLANAGAANELETCSTAGIGLQSGVPEELQVQNDVFSATLPEPGCPQASKIGTVNINSPLLGEELVGSVYMAAQNVAPFRSPLAIYLIAEAPVSKLLVKLAGEVNITSTGQLVTTFHNTPDLPFETLRVHLFDGPRALQSSPAFCGAGPEQTTHASFSPWGEQDAPASAASSTFAITAGAAGGPCPSDPLPLQPSLLAGVANTQAASFASFTVTIDKPDGQQALERISVTSPPGLAAVIANVARCPNPQSIPLETASEPACPATSLVGHVTTLSGLGGAPVSLPGKLYLTEGYGGAPFGLLAVTEAHAGPFNLGFVNVRSQIFVNRETTAVTVVSEPLPKLVKGIPTQVKQLTVSVERPGNEPFEFNPTNCDVLSITGVVTGYEGAQSSISEPFQATNCGALPFTPKLTASVAGQGSKADGTTFAVKLESPGIGQANIHKVDLTIPAVLPSRLSTIQKACVEAVFDANPASCDEGSVIGEAIIHTPVFKNPLRGPAYLVSHGGTAFPDVEFVLQGEGVTLVLDGKTDIKKDVTYSRFETSPDAPFTSVETIFPAGPHSALAPSVPEKENYNLCKQSISLPTEITAQDGAFISQDTKVAVTGCGSVKGFTKKLTNAQLLAKALKVCKRDKKRSERVACEKAARKRYAPKGSKSSHKRMARKR